VCVCVCVCMCVYVCVCVRECVWNQKKYMHVYIYIYVCKHKSESAYARVFISFVMCGGGQASEGVVNRGKVPEEPFVSSSSSFSCRHITGCRV